MYIGLVCLVLFDARGNETLVDSAILGVAGAMALLLIGSTHLPKVLYRHQLVDSLCADLLVITTYALAVISVPNQILRNACALHGICYCTQYRFLDRSPCPVLLHTILVLILVAYYTWGPRITDIREFVLSAVFAHLIDFVASVVIRAHQVAVAWTSDQYF